jgi:hypothetical protein
MARSPQLATTGQLRPKREPVAPAATIRRLLPER